MRLQELYKKKNIPELKKEVEYKNNLEAPGISKVVINVGFGRHSKEKAYIDAVIDGLTRISGQKPVRTKAKKGMQIGQQIHIAVRPERVIFIENEDFNYCTYEGRVIDVIYLGDVTKYYIQLTHAPQNGSEGVVIMKVQNRLGTKKHNRGDTVRIGWNELDATIV